MGKVKKDKVVTKPIVDTKNKPHSPKKKKSAEKKNAEDWNRKFGFIFPQSVKTMAESAGIVGVSDDVANSLAEDVSYRLRSIIQLCAKYLKHTRHKRLRCEDVNEVLQLCDVPPVIGHAVQGAPSTFTAVREANVLILDDPEVDLNAFALAEISVARKPPVTATGKWIVAENLRNKHKLDEMMGETAESVRANQSNNVGNKTEDGKPIENNKVADHLDNEPEIPANLIKYYGITCNTILGHSELKMVYRDLSKNEKILPIVPYLLNFITITLNKLYCERQIMRLLHTVEALTENRKVDFRPYLPVTRVAHALLKIIKIVAVEKNRDLRQQIGHNQALERGGQKIQFSHNHVTRIRAAKVLAKVERRWCCSEEHRATLVHEMILLLSELHLPPRVHIGALALVKELGPSALRTAFWNSLKTFLAYTENVRQNRSALVLLILESAQVLYRNPHGFEVTDCPPADRLDADLYEYFGDTICPSRLQLLENPRFLQRHFPTPKPCPELKPADTILKGTWRLPKCKNSMYNPEAKRPTVHTAFDLPEVTKKRNPRIIFKFVGANPVPEMSLRRRRLDSRYSQFIAGKVSEGHVVLVGKFWRRPKPQPAYSQLKTASIFSVL